ncbi:MAG: hypothetical protein ACTSRG_18980 [Candidatus Helarchaeota archaeon]
MSPIVVRRGDFNFYKTTIISLFSNIMIGWFVYALFAENYIGNQFFNNLGYIFVPVLRPDFIIYFFIIPAVTTFWNIIYQTTDKMKYWIKIYPIMYMMAPFFLDNYYFLLNHVPLDSFIEIQFIFISHPTVLEYILLTLFYLFAGFITMFYAERILHVLIAYAFAIAQYSSLLISSILEPQILEMSIYLATAPRIGIFLGNYLRLWYVSFEVNYPAYLSTYFLIVLIVSIVFLYFRYKIGRGWWDKRPIDVSKMRVTRLVVVLEDRKSK